MVIYVANVDVPKLLKSMVDLPTTLALSVYEWGRLKAHFKSSLGPVWLVPKQACPGCATRRNLADSPGA